MISTSDISSTEQRSWVLHEIRFPSSWDENQQGSNTAFISTSTSSSSTDQSKSMHSAANIENPRSTLYPRHFLKPESSRSPRPSPGSHTPNSRPTATKMRS